MTHVVSAKSPKGDLTLAIGQIWQTKTNGLLSVVSMEMLPDMNAKGNNTRITFVDEFGEVSWATFIDFVDQIERLEKDVDIGTLGGLHDYHLLELSTTIAVGQRWQHYKGDVYVITSVALDANVGVDDFNKARISYRPLQAGKTPEWSLSVEEFLRLTDRGGKRFTPVRLTGKDKRDVIADKSLRFYWRISA